MRLDDAAVSHYLAKLRYAEHPNQANKDALWKAERMHNMRRNTAFKLIMATTEELD
jgi:hypothetical protein